MAKLSTKTSFTNAIITKEDEVFFIEEFNSKGESQGKWNLTQQLDNVVDAEGIKLSFDTTNELDSEF
jgi:hypothetical protein